MYHANKVKDFSKKVFYSYMKDGVVHYTIGIRDTAEMRAYIEEIIKAKGGAAIRCQRKPFKKAKGAFSGSHTHS